MNKTNGINGNELLIYIKSIASERGIDYREVLEIFAESLAHSLKRSSPDYKNADFRVVINPEEGGIEAFRRWRVLSADEEMENPQHEITLATAREQSGEDGVAAGDIIEEPMEDATFDRRVGMLSAKQNFNTRLRDAERRRLLSDLLSRNEELVHGQVTRVLREKGDVIVEVSQVNCRLPHREMIPREVVKVGDKVQALIKETAAPDKRDQQIVLTRTAPEFLIRLFQRTVPEIEKGILEIVAAVRSPGNRAKIAVRSSDPRIDPIGTCVGIKGSRVQSVTNELKGERIDIIHWDKDDAKYVLRALAPAEVSKINVDRERRRMDVLVEPDLMAQALGKNGTNVKLASRLTGWDLNLQTPDEHEEEMSLLAAKKSESLAAVLDLEVEAARILYDEGFESAEHIAYAQASELEEIDGFEAEVVESLQARAKEAVEKRDARITEKLMSVDERMRAAVNDEQLLYDLAAEDVLTLEDLADLGVPDLLEIAEIPQKQAAKLIMWARTTLEEEEAASGEEVEHS